MPLAEWQLAYYISFSWALNFNGFYRIQLKIKADMGFKSRYSDTKWLHKFKGIYGINKN
jgi:hypothetical protein